MLRVVLFRCDELRMQHIFSSVNIHKILVFMCIFALDLNFYMDTNLKLKSLSQMVCKVYGIPRHLYIHIRVDKSLRKNHHKNRFDAEMHLRPEICKRWLCNLGSSVTIFIGSASFSF